ncbi:zinc-ribbon domain-containing protein [Priestia megaterium]|uniref:zinc-ribbon domain-containing protein n=1 Tax=Priestia megaterium TaxID=1404 RepID=UPI000BFCE4A2|nr:zinc-ribbon domain-containing protein [Priestia megaterium]PGQ87668.1 hypothetical protein COA18_07510 [Priestia megaterium]
MSFKKITLGLNSLANENPIISSEWHPTRNEDLTPQEVVAGSHKRVWWQCSKGHEWQAVIKSRKNGNGCPYCSNKKVSIDNSLASLYSELAQEWHLVKNDSLTAQDVTPGSGKKVWWQCSKGHEWQAVIKSRKDGSGCPYCSGRRVHLDNCLETLYPNLAKEWHPSKNKTLTAKDVTSGSDKKIWWQCKNGHEWNTNVYKRTGNGKTGCPYCANQRVWTGNSLYTNNLELSSQWHPTKNQKLTPKDVVVGSHKKVWWQCTKGHEWQAVIKERHKKGRGCPICINQKVHLDNCLATINPTLAQEWHSTKNGTLTADDVVAGSDKKVWWQCKEGHEWQTKVNSRNRGSSCPICINKQVHLDNNLAASNQALTQEWHPTKNATLTPNDVVVGSGKKVWWQCNKGHEWESRIVDRHQGLGCPYCSNRYVTPQNSLATRFPEIAAEWHPTKNGALTPDDVVAGSDKKVWWQCKRNHEWQASPNTRKKSGCPQCSFGTGTSFPEQIVYLTLKDVFPHTKNRYKIEDVEIDIYIPEINVAIEYDGAYYHDNRKEKDEQKNKFMLERNIPLIRIQEKSLKSTKHTKFENVWHTIIRENPESDSSLEECIHGLHDIFSTHVNISRYPIYKLKGQAVSKYRYDALKRARYVIEEKSLGYVNAKLAAEWHPTKNGTLTPDDVFAGSHERVWWRCDQGHEWQTSIANRSLSGTRCPYCSGKLVTLERSLATLEPELAKQWDFKKNKPLKPIDVSCYANKEVWWRCEQGHEWQTSIANRSSSGTGCPYCSGRLVTLERSLATLEPELAKQWDFEKNKPLTPSDVSRHSTKEVWWHCDQGHEWQAKITNRTKRNHQNCPHCTVNLTILECSLAVAEPELAKQWNYEKNKPLTPEDVPRHSKKEVWWRCEQGHEWQTKITSRTKSKSRHCPHCAKVVKLESSLATLKPELAKQWGYEKNKPLTPSDVSLYSNRKVWWKCEQGHEWQSKVASRTTSKHNYCPYCIGRKVYKNT